MHRLITTIIMLMLSLGVMAQNDDIVIVGYGKNDSSVSVKFLAKNQCCPIQTPPSTTDKKTKLTSIVWPTTEHDWIKDTCWVKAPVADDFYTVFPNKNTPPKNFSLLYWMLTEENDETVLHCYFTMPSDIVTNLWLASEETAIVDWATGVQYRARRTVPECTNKHIGIKAPIGTPLDFKIYFPKLPETTKEISIFGVPEWELYGEPSITLTRYSANHTSDNLPPIKKARLIQDENDYKIHEHLTWSIYTDAHLIKPVKEGTLAIWTTPKATYLAIAHEQNWMREYYGVHEKTFLLDNRGNQYKIKDLWGYPLGHTFWVNGYSGDFIAFLLVFEPLPADVTTFSYIESEDPKYDLWRANWDSKIRHNLNVNELRRNQSLFEPIERVIKE
ncbi:MAG: hypothetical protein IKQ70_13190 [Bacteroidales bacterium]|nr:hypothetical protein [Bacteroidales bacterium]